MKVCPTVIDMSHFFKACHSKKGCKIHQSEIFWVIVNHCVHLSLLYQLAKQSLRTPFSSSTESHESSCQRLLSNFLSSKFYFRFKMEVETSFQPIRAQDSIEDNDVRLDQGLANELEAYSGLQIDFESEFSDFLSGPRPADNSNEEQQQTQQPKTERRRGSNVSLGTLQTRLDYNIDGTINCTDINYNTIVSCTEHVGSIFLLSKKA